MNSDIVHKLVALIVERDVHRPPNSYTTQLLAGPSAHLKRKVAEEAIEVITAEHSNDIASESADLLYHLFVYWQKCGITLEQVL